MVVAAGRRSLLRPREPPILRHRDFQGFCVCAKSLGNGPLVMLAHARTGTRCARHSALGAHIRGLAHAVPATQPSALAQWPLLVANFVDRGRGLIADRDIAQGQPVLCEHFFVCAPHQRPESGWQQEVADTATVLHAWPPAAQLDARMQREGRHFPRLVLRIAENILADFVRDPRANAQASWGRVRELCRPKIADIPPAWRQDFHAVRQAMVGDASPSSSKVEVKADDPLLPCNPVLFDMLFSPDWYAQVMGICHLNSFCVPRPPSAADPAPPGTVGGLFLTASLFNHSCANNIAPAWVDQETDRGGNGAPCHGDVLEGRAAPGLATLRQPNMCFIATRDIAPGEECTVAYVDVSLKRRVRRKQLKFAYGFDCCCAKCLQGTRSGTASSKSR